MKWEGNVAALLELASGFDGDLTVREIINNGAATTRGVASTPRRLVRTQGGTQHDPSSFGHHLSFFYQPGPARSSPWLRVALHVRAVPCSDLLRRDRLHDHFLWNGHFQSAKRPADTEAGNGKGHCGQRGHDRPGPVRFFRQRELLGAVPVGCPPTGWGRGAWMPLSTTMWHSTTPAAT